MDDVPIRDREIAQIFADLEGMRNVALAVSGGADSIALLHLAVRWRKLSNQNIPNIIILTVDHGLRREAHQEARWVCRIAEGVGLSHAILRWQGTKPSTNLQASARQARYDLLTTYCHENGIRHLVTAHHLDDQAETVLMRLARGSGVDGLAAIAKTGHWAGIKLVRPLLDFPKRRLIATLKAGGLHWLEDPTNSSTQFERNRVRQAMTDLGWLGLKPERLALAASRMRRAQQALEATTDRFLGEHVMLDAAGHCAVKFTDFRAAPAEIALRALRRMVMAIGGNAESPRLTKLEALYNALRHSGDTARTLAGCRIISGDQRIRILREPGRLGLPELKLTPGTSSLWDRRFKVSASSGLVEPVTVRALGRTGFFMLRRTHGIEQPCSSDIGAGLVSFWRGDDLICVPHLGYHSKTIIGNTGVDIKAMCRADFVNDALLRSNIVSNVDG